MQIATVAQPLTSSSSGSRALAPSDGLRPDVPIKSEGRMSHGAGAGYPQPARILPTSSGAQAPLPRDALPDVMMIHSDLEEDEDC